MAPIDPNQLLAAFAPLLTSTGGIKNASEVPRLSSLMKKFSRKLVSRCVYCNVLLATTTDVLEEFLRSGGWETIHLWIKSAKELGNKPFLEELLKLLLILPMNVERLRENDSPKMIKSLSKSEDSVIAQKAKLIVEKWTKMIETASGVRDSKEKDHKKKRKKDGIELTNSDSKDSTSCEPKKLKINTKQELNPIDCNSTDSNVSFDSVKEELKPKLERTPRPSTAKVKPGKSRLDGLVNSQTNALNSRKELPKNTNNIKKVSTNVNNKSITSSISSISESLNTNTTNSALTLNKPKVPVIESKPLVVNTTANPMEIPLSPPAPVVATPAIKHVLQDSTSFMDALIAPPTQAKKKRRTSASGTKDNNTSADASTSSPKASSPPKFSFYTDMIDERVGQQVDELPIAIDTEDDSNEYESNNRIEEPMDDSNSEPNEETNHMNVDIAALDISAEPPPEFAVPTVISNTNSTLKVKPILCYVKKGSKKSVRWVEDSRLQAVRYFELDETERVNVNRPAGAGGFNDLKRSDMQHEAQFMRSARQTQNACDISDDYMSRAESFSPWKLIPCDGDTNLVEVGKDSKERHIQAERMRTTLEPFYNRNKLPDAPQEPESEVYVESVEMKVIPLEDDNNPNNCHDFSNIDLPAPKTGEHLPSRSPEFKAGQPPSANFAGMPPTSVPFTPGVNPQLLPGAPNFAGQPMIPPFGNQPLLTQPGDPFAGHPPLGPQQPFYPSNNGPPFQQWSDPSGGPRPPPPHFVPPFPNPGPPQGRGMGQMGRPPRLPRNAQNTVCKHFARTGKCRFQPRCHFLHSNDR